ncbi:MAG TPA: hypothetical protein P5299_01345 [Candidatus Woesebacteria bacterium]|nr:hypothetical protein [Candidatus Woesebacteria bacterium]HRT39995.1 hypothetical protein [Candidatus Woesebacteria bacterium]
MEVKEERLVGEITHYYDKIGVAVVKALAPIEIGQTIHIKSDGGKTDFTQTVESMETEHQRTDKVEAGQVIGMKVVQKVEKGDKIYLL